jgi:hypothetical protein
LPGLNFGTLHAGILISFPVLGFLPVLDARFVHWKVPKPVKVILSLFLRALVMFSMKEFNTFSATDFLIPASAATPAIKSALVIYFTSLRKFVFEKATSSYQYGGAGS